MLFVWQLFGRGQVSLLRRLKLSISVTLDLSSRIYSSSRISSRIRHTAVANFHIGLVKKSLKFVEMRKMLGNRCLPFRVLNHLIALTLFLVDFGCFK